MAGYTVQRSGFLRVPEMFYQIAQDLIANGFVMKFPNSPLMAPMANTDYAPFKVTLEAGPEIDPLNASQPWRIQLHAVATQTGDVIFGTPLQLAKDGTTATLDADFGGTNFPIGILTAPSNTDSFAAAGGAPSNRFIQRYERIKTNIQAATYPFSYRLTITDHGVALVVWEDGADDQAKNYSWFVCQRPVDHITGKPLVTGHCPLVCLYGLTPSNLTAVLGTNVSPTIVLDGVYKFIVRESDVNRPTRPVHANIDTEDSSAIINNRKQVAITENNRYVITFPNGINTPRYMYTEELDMIAYTSADVVSQYADVPITVYGEAAPRTYKAMQANHPYNQGMRILVLVKGAGVGEAAAPAA